MRFERAREAISSRTDPTATSLDPGSSKDAGDAISVATLIGFIALAGVAAEFGIIMLLYLRQGWERQLAINANSGEAELDLAIREGAVQRVRPKAMTVAVILAGLLPILIGAGAGSEVMQRIAAPMIGGMITAPLLSMLVIPVVYRTLEMRRLRRSKVPELTHVATA